MTEETRERLERRYHPDLERVVFGEFDAQLERWLARDAIVLDAGSGPGSWIIQPYRERLGMLIGADVYLPDTSNLDAFVMADSMSLPFATDSLDVIVSYLVLEHLSDPASALKEYARVLKPGGVFCFKTPAVRTPLFLLAKVLPTRAHKRLKSGIGIDEDDVFPTYYRANDTTSLHQVLVGAGFGREWLRTVDQTYAYLTHRPWTYALGLLYSRMTECSMLSWLRNQIIGVYRLAEEL